MNEQKYILTEEELLNILGNSSNGETYGENNLKYYTKLITCQNCARGIRYEDGKLCNHKKYPLDWFCPNAISNEYKIRKEEN